MQHLKTYSSILILSVALLACSKPVSQATPVRAVKVATVTKQNLQANLEFSGEVKAHTESNLGFRVGGKILTRSVDLGQRVKVGQKLATLDPADYQLSVQAAKAQVQAATAARDLAKANLQRYTTLRNQNFISSAQLEQYQTAFDTTQAQLQQALAQEKLQNNQAAYTTLTANISGVVTAINAEAGQVVAAGTPIVKIAHDGEREVQFAIAEDKIQTFKLGMPMKIKAWSGEQTYDGRISELSASADAITRTFLAKIDLQSASALPLGSTVSVYPVRDVQDKSADLIKIPTSALRSDGKTTSVWILNPSTMIVKAQGVQVVNMDGNQVVVGAGLTPGQLYVVAGVHTLNEGEKVSIYGQPTGTSIPIGKQEAAKAQGAALAVPAK